MGIDNIEKTVAHHSSFSRESRQEISVDYRVSPKSRAIFNSILDCCRAINLDKPETLQKTVFSRPLYCVWRMEMACSLYTYCI